MKKLLFILGITALTQMACEPNNDITYIIPTTYNFENVNYDNQTARKQMLEEIATYVQSANVMGATPLDASKMLNMYKNTGSPFMSSVLNNSSAQIKNKVATGKEEDYTTYINRLALVSQSTNQTAAAGQPGIIVSTTDNTKSYLVDGNGIEWAQLIEKGLAGACFYYQASTIYLGNTKMAVDNKIVTPGKGTAMEHHWDEAFGYFGAPIDFPGNINGLLLWADYSNQVNSTLGCNSKIMNGFLKGRAAISADDYAAREEAIQTIRKEWETMIAAIAISYLNRAKGVPQDQALCFHYLTKAYGFIMGLKHGGAPNITESQINAVLVQLAGNANPLSANFYNTSTQSIDNTINDLAIIFTSLESVKTSL